MQKILILGAGVYQVPLIRKAKELGYYTIVVSIQGNYPGFSYADKVYYVDTTDKDEVLKIARDEKISAICTTGTDVCMPTLGWVCDNLELNGITYDAAIKASNKWLMKEALLMHNVCTPYGYKIMCVEEAMDGFIKLDKNGVLKVVDKSGSRGIFHVQTEDEVKSAYEQCMEITDMDYLVIEKYIAGKEIGVSGMIQDNTIKCIVPHEKIMVQEHNTSIQIGHIFNQSINQSINQSCASALDALHIDNAAFNFDIILQKENVYIIEMAARCGATGIPECMGIIYGTDYFKCIIDNAAGKSVNFSALQNKYAASYLFHSKHDGVLRSIHYPKIGEVIFDYNIGDIIPKFENATKRIGAIIITADSNAELTDKMSQLKNIQVRVDE